LFDFYNEISRRVIQDVTNAGGSLSIERKPFSGKNQTLRLYKVYISPAKYASSALIE